MARATLCLALLSMLALGHGSAEAQMAPADEPDAVRTRRAARAQRLVDRAHALARGGNRASALGTYRQAVQIDPRAEDAYLGLADLYEQARRLGDAFEAVRVGLARRPQSAKLQMRLAALHASAGDRREALGLLREVVQRDPNHVEALRRYVDVAKALGAWSEALRGARRLRRLAHRGLMEGADELELQVRALSLLARPLDGACQASSEPLRNALCP